MREGGVPPDPAWPRGFEEHALAQRRRLARLTLGEKLRWLEDAHALVRNLERSRRGEALG